MKPELRFETKLMKTGGFGESTSVPDLAGKAALQNRLEFSLDEDDEIFEGYGKRVNSYPYRQTQAYDRSLKDVAIKTAVLENDFLKAVFLPELGGRLWELLDKKTERNLLYTNDVIRFSNLAICNAWFSGGVEWNIGMIGHTPFTTRPLYTARLEMEDRTPVLRMYEYERVRGTEYQMDFWLGEGDRELNCRMRIMNSGGEVVPMYWWSNMAVPEYEGGRLIVPAKEAYTSNYQNVYKTQIPYVDGVDVTRYEEIPAQVDYFFNIPREQPKYIAHVGRDGYGLIQYSTGRLRGRKLFSWGHKTGGGHWQEFLTEEAGPYVEIQAGLGKTQYGCIPMPPHTAWEWLEKYGSVQISREERSLPFEELRDRFTRRMTERILAEKLEERLEETRTMAKKKAELVFCGDGYGALKEEERKITGERSLSGHLEYHFARPRQKAWADFLKTGELAVPSPDERPDGFLYGSVFCEKLREAVQGTCRKNWYAHYQLGLLYLEEGKEDLAEQEFLASRELEETPWICHALGSLYILTGKKEEASAWLVKGIRKRPCDLSYVKEGFRLLLSLNAHKEVLELYSILPEEIRRESRLIFDYYAALGETGDWEQVHDYLERHPDFVLEDLRECEDDLAELWRRSCEGRDGKTIDELPRQWDFESL